MAPTPGAVRLQRTRQQQRPPQCRLSERRTARPRAHDFRRLMTRARAGLGGLLLVLAVLGVLPKAEAAYSCTSTADCEYLGCAGLESNYCVSILEIAVCHVFCDIYSHVFCDMYGVYGCVVHSASVGHALHMLNFHSTAPGCFGSHGCTHVPDFLVLVSHFCSWDAGCLCGWIHGMVPGGCWHYSARGHANM